MKALLDELKLQYRGVEHIALNSYMKNVLMKKLGISKNKLKRYLNELVGLGLLKELGKDTYQLPEN
jgi:DNA-binding IclR family transcriptional regulator